MATIRILVVDDSHQWRSLVRSMLERIPGFCVVGEACDGLEAIKQTLTFLPDVVLLDIGMPRLNGIEAAKKIRQVCPESNIIFLSQESDSDVTAAALATGAVAYVSKSTANSELRPTIEAAYAHLPPTARARLSVSESSSSL